jgi:hypothetical protein
MDNQSLYVKYEVSGVWTAKIKVYEYHPSAG